MERRTPALGRWVGTGRGPTYQPGTVCDECGRPEPEVRLSHCTGCLVAHFCANACSRAAWPAHRAEC